MSDMTIDQLQAENDSLTAELEKVKAKNAELLDELKAARKSRAAESFREQVEALEAEKAELQEELRKHTFEYPVNAAFAEMSPAGKHFRRAFEEHFDVVQDEEDGKFYIHDKDGNPVMKEVKQGKYGTRDVRRELTFAEVQELIFVQELKELDFFLHKPFGLSAPGSKSTTIHRAKPEPEAPKKEEKSQQFGIR